MPTLEIKATARRIFLLQRPTTSKKKMTHRKLVYIPKKRKKIEISFFAWKVWDSKSFRFFGWIVLIGKGAINL